MTTDLFKLPPFAHQSEALKRGALATFFAYLMEMGTGKTKVLIDNVAMLFRRRLLTGVLVVAPKSIVRNWVLREIPTHLPDDVAGEARVLMWDGTAAREREIRKVLAGPPLEGLVFLVINVEAFVSARARDLCADFLRWRRSLMVVDESVVIKNPGAQRTKVCLKLGRLAAYRRILSGMPVTQGPLDIYSQFEFLQPGALGFGSWYAFRARYAVLQKKFFGGRSVQVVVAYRNVEELAGKIAPHSYRVKKEDCLDLPPKVYTLREVELTDEQRRIYRQLRDEAQAALLDPKDTCRDCDGSGWAGHEDSGVKCSLCAGEGTVPLAYVSATQVITQLLRMHQVVCGHVTDELGVSHEIPSNRVAVLLEVIDELPAGEKVIVWCNYRADVDRVCAKLREVYGAETVARHDGSCTMEQRGAAIDSFQNGGSRFFVSTQATGGRGLTLTSASTVVYYSNSYDLEMRSQSEDRAHRIGQTAHKVTYVDLVAEATVDEKIIGALRTKMNIASAIVGEGAREWLI